MRFLLCCNLLLLICTAGLIAAEEEFVEDEEHLLTLSKQPESVSDAKDRRYILFEVNFGEGFNLRRDVYMRMARVVQLLRESGHNYILVLPPFGNLFHWQDGAIQVPWSEFFDVPSLNRLVPVIEFTEYLEENGNKVDLVLYLQHYKEGWRDGKWEERYQVRDCIDAKRYYTEQPNGDWRGFFYAYEDVVAIKMLCFSIQGESKTLVKAITEKYLDRKSLFIDRAETILHDEFGSTAYWQARRSMRYSKLLRSVGDKYREEFLDSSNETDGIVYPEDWTEETELERTATGGNYVAVHLRRRDFVRSHSDKVPDINEAAIQITDVAKKLQLVKVFVCTDAESTEVAQLSALLKENGIQLYQLKLKEPVLDGALAIIDQWIAAKARYFLGTASSTFSYRIREDREIMRFPMESTFNDLCKLAKQRGTKDCDQPAKWKIVY